MNKREAAKLLKLLAAVPTTPLAATKKSTRPQSLEAMLWRDEKRMRPDLTPNAKNPHTVNAKKRRGRKPNRFKPLTLKAIGLDKLLK